MQASIQARSLNYPMLFVVICYLAISCRQSFDAAIEKHRNTLVDQVNQPSGKDLPFFTIQTLNPVWQIAESTPIVRMPKFQLIDQDGQHRDESLFTGRISIVGFMFASCQGFCPFLISGMKSLDRSSNSEADDTQFVALTVNPEDDTPQILKSYAADHKLDTAGKRWVFLTGDKETIYSLAKDTFASQAFKRPNTESNFVHSEHLYVIDRQGRLRGVLNGTRTDLVRDGLALLERLKR